MFAGDATTYGVLCDRDLDRSPDSRSLVTDDPESSSCPGALTCWSAGAGFSRRTT